MWRRSTAGLAVKWAKNQKNRVDGAHERSMRSWNIEKLNISFGPYVNGCIVWSESEWRTSAMNNYCFQTYKSRAHVTILIEIQPEAAKIEGFATCADPRLDWINRIEFWRHTLFTLTWVCGVTPWQKRKRRTKEARTNQQELCTHFLRKEPKHNHALQKSAWPGQRKKRIIR